MTECVHTVSLRHRAGPLDLDVNFRLHAAWTVLFAPSGAGKTTILRMMAGLERPDAGVIHFGGTPELQALDSARGIDVPPHRRGLRMVAQRPALFPHLTVLENVRYGMDRQRREDDFLFSDENVERLLDVCRVPRQLYGERPARLSGGERQRVALARALATGSARLLLLDEPFTGLEAKLRDELIRDLRMWLAERRMPVLLVTHDLSEVFAAGAHVLKMEGGRIVASGPAGKVLAAERDRLVAGLHGLEAGQGMI